MELRLEGVSKTYPVRSDAIHALEDINPNVAEGGLVCLVGQSGCGKSTLLQIVAGLEQPTNGQVYAGGELVSELDRL